MAANEIALRRQLYGAKPRDEVQVTREVYEAARALATATEAWTTFLPRRSAIESVQHTVIGLGRLLAELQVLQEGPPNAA